MKVIYNGMLEMETAREIKGVTPAMMRWWSVHRTKERYKLSHPDHIDFQTLYKPEEGHIGSVYAIKEKHGRFMLDMKVIVQGITDSTFTHVQIARGYRRQTHLVFEPTPDGMILHSHHIIGSDNPVWGPLWNWVTRKFLISDEYRAAIAKHGQEETANYAKFLPQLYAQYGAQDD